MLIETKRLTLRAVEPEDAGFLARLFNEAGAANPDAPRELIYPISEESELAWISSLPRRSADAHMIIEKRKGGAALGIISVDEMDWRNASARLRIRLTRESWESGYGTEAVGATVAFLFDRMNFRRVWVRVDEGNSRAIRCFEQCGFVLEGVLREDHVRDGGWKNSLLMSILSSDQRRAGHD
jgi:RimJ/RimL family protein N-acetyltransferase